MRDLKKISKFWYWVYIAVISISILFTVNYVFKIGAFGINLIDTAFLYILLACFISTSFIIYPFNSKSAKDHVPLYDVILFCITIPVFIYFSFKALDISLYGWSLQAPTLPTVLSVIAWILVLESLRRTSGNVLFVICLLFSFYPLIANSMPGIFRGMQFDFLTTARSHLMGLDSVLGTPLQTVGTLLVGFMIFGVVLNETGGGKFFNDFSMALLGKGRAGTAKSSVVSSALFGSLSGSAVSNTATIGNIAIPAMEKEGYDGVYAGAIQACASTGGTIMPPVMGAAAFIMSSFMGVPYGEIVIAAIIPSVLYYFGLFVQVDAHAGLIDLKPQKLEERRRMRDVMKEGWPFLTVLIILIVFLLFLRIEAYAPYGAVVFLFLIAIVRKTFSLDMLLRTIYNSGKTLIELVAVLAGIGLIVGALSITGVALSFSRELVAIVGDNIILLLFAGAITSFILGMGMTSTACYIFLYIVMVPALVRFGINPMAANLYVLYWGIVSFITPPVALASITAAKIANVDPMKTGFKSMQLGIVTYFIPFLFVYEPALLAQGPWPMIIYAFIRTAFAVYLIGCALEGYMSKVEVKIGLPIRVALIVSGVLIALPGNAFSDIAGYVLAVVLLFITLAKKRKEGSLSIVGVRKS